jgi:hypothetical protein
MKELCERCARWVQVANEGWLACVLCGRPKTTKGQQVSALCHTCALRKMVKIRRPGSHPLRKVTIEIVQEMRRLYQTGVTCYQLASQFGVSYGCVRPHVRDLIAKRKSEGRKIGQTA